jgi:hypothetical protein
LLDESTDRTQHALPCRPRPVSLLNTGQRGASILAIRKVPGCRRASTA